MNRHHYEQDFAAWAEEQATLLRAGALDALDVENLAEEVESLGRSDRRELDSRLTVLMTHLLRFRYQPEQRSGSWRGTIWEQRRSIGKLLNESPSLRPRLPGELPESYADARGRALRDTGLDHLPVDYPFTLEQVLDTDWLPT